MSSYEDETGVKLIIIIIIIIIIIPGSRWRTCEVSSLYLENCANARRIRGLHSEIRLFGSNDRSFYLIFQVRFLFSFFWIIIMSLTPVSSSDEDIGGVPSMQSSYSAGMKRCGICMVERSPLWVRRSKSEETLCRLLITMVEETFDIRRSWVDHGKRLLI